MVLTLAVELLALRGSNFSEPAPLARRLPNCKFSGCRTLTCLRAIMCAQPEQLRGR